MFDVAEFVTSCQAALKEHTPQLAVKELLERTVSRAGDVESALGTPTTGGITPLHRSPELTILNVIWAPSMQLYPHDHRMWAVIGIYGGQEDNAFYRRSPDGLTRAGFKELQIKDVEVLGQEVIHAVANPKQVFTGGIHIYGGDFFAQPRSEWDPDTLEERPWSIDTARRAFEEANERWLAEQAISG